MNERSPCDKGGRIPGAPVTRGLETEGRGAPVGSELAQVQSSTPKGSGGQQGPEHREGTGVSLEFPAGERERHTLGGPGPVSGQSIMLTLTLGASAGSPSREEVAALPKSPSKGPLRILSHIANPKRGRMPPKGSSWQSGKRGSNDEKRMM